MNFDRPRMNQLLGLVCPLWTGSNLNVIVVYSYSNVIECESVRPARSYGVGQARLGATYPFRSDGATTQILQRIGGCDSVILQPIGMQDGWNAGRPDGFPGSGPLSGICTRESNLCRAVIIPSFAPSPTLSGTPFLPDGLAFGPATHTGGTGQLPLAHQTITQQAQGDGASSVSARIANLPLHIQQHNFSFASPPLYSDRSMAPFPGPPPEQAGY